MKRRQRTISVIAGLLALSRLCTLTGDCQAQLSWFHIGFAKIPMCEQALKFARGSLVADAWSNTPRTLQVRPPAVVFWFYPPSFCTTMPIYDSWEGETPAPSSYAPSSTTPSSLELGTVHEDNTIMQEISEVEAFHRAVESDNENEKRDKEGSPSPAQKEGVKRQPTRQALKLQGWRLFLTLPRCAFCRFELKAITDRTQCVDRSFAGDYGQLNRLDGLGNDWKRF